MESASAIYRSALRGKRMVLLLDNVDEVEVVPPLVPSSIDCVITAVSQESLDHLMTAGARPTADPNDAVSGTRALSRVRTAAPAESVAIGFAFSTDGRWQPAGQPVALSVRDETF